MLFGSAWVVVQRPLVIRIWRAWGYVHTDIDWGGRGKRQTTSMTCNASWHFLNFEKSAHRSTHFEQCRSVALFLKDVWSKQRLNLLLMRHLHVLCLCLVRKHFFLSIPIPLLLTCVLHVCAQDTHVFLHSPPPSSLSLCVCVGKMRGRGATASQTPYLDRAMTSNFVQEGRRGRGRKRNLRVI